MGWIEDPYKKEREKMVKEQIEARGITNPLVLAAMRDVPRHKFVPKDMIPLAYSDRPLPIGFDQTISQPYIVAYMTQCLRLTGDEKVLEIGTGLGYQAAVLSKIASKVYTIERIPELAEKARKILKELGYNNVEVIIGDGTKGLPEEAPFDGIIVTASGPYVPETLKKQLKVGGRLVMPVGKYRYAQRIVRITRGVDDNFKEEELLDVLFVPLIGEYGWNE